MRVSDRGLIALAAHEGLVVAPYKDVVGVWTIGVGHTVGAGQPDPAKMSKAMPADINGKVAEMVKLFADDLRKYEDRVNDAVKVPLEQHEFDALVSFDFNTGGIYKARLTKSLNRGDRSAAARQFMGWLKPEAIRGRRTAEMRLFETGEYPRHKTPVYGTNGKGGLRGIVSQIAPNELLSMLDAAQGATSAPQPRITPTPQAPSETQGRESIWASKMVRSVTGIVTTNGTAAVMFWDKLDETDKMIAGGLFAVALICCAVIFSERLRYWVGGLR